MCCYPPFLSSFCGIESASTPSLSGVAGISSVVVENSSLSSASLPHILSPSPPTYFVELRENSMLLYGASALEAIEASVQLRNKHPIQELCFSYMEFEDIALWLPKLTLTCPHVTVSHVMVM